MEFRIYQCNNATNSSRSCVAQSSVETYLNIAGAVYATLTYVNPLINPGNSEYLDYFVEDKNLISFTKTSGVISFGYVQDYSI